MDNATYFRLFPQGLANSVSQYFDPDQKFKMVLLAADQRIVRFGVNVWHPAQNIISTESYESIITRMREANATLAASDPKHFKPQGENEEALFHFFKNMQSLVESTNKKKVIGRSIVPPDVGSDNWIVWCLKNYATLHRNLYIKELMRLGSIEDTFSLSSSDVVKLVEERNLKANVSDFGSFVKSILRALITINNESLDEAIFDYTYLGMYGEYIPLEYTYLSTLLRELEIPFKDFVNVNIFFGCLLNPEEFITKFWNALTQKHPKLLDKIFELCLEGSNNLNFAYIPPEIGHLKKLKILTLLNANFDTLPESMLSLISLQSLSIRSCKYLRELPKDICYLEKLEHLVLVDCPIVNLPTEIRQLSKLRRLDLTESCITDLPESLLEIENIETLGISLTDSPKLRASPVVQELDAQGKIEWLEEGDEG
jgi:hypothetical protein